MKCIALSFISKSGSDPWSPRVGSKKDAALATVRFRCLTRLKYFHHEVGMSGYQLGMPFSGPRMGYTRPN